MKNLFLSIFKKILTIILFFHEKRKRKSWIVCFMIDATEAMKNVFIAIKDLLLDFNKTLRTDTMQKFYYSKICYINSKGNKDMKVVFNFTEHANQFQHFLM
jgi:hypothetical protein